MANRVNVNINVNDLSRTGLNQFNRQLRRTQRQARRAGTDIRFNVTIPDGASRREIRRIRRVLRSRPVTIRTQINPPTPPATTLRRRIAATLGRAITLPVRLTHRGLVGGVRGPLRALGGMASGIMQDGIGQGLINGFRAGGPVGVAFLAVAITALFAIIGAALSGLLITAFGAAFVGIAAFSAAKSNQVKEQWSHTLGVLKKEFAGVGKPLIPVLDRALERIEKMATKFAPTFKKAIAETAPATEEFINKLMDGFESFGKEAFKPIMSAWNTFAPVFGEQWNEFMKELGQAFADMADLVKKHPTEIAAALEIVFEVLTLLVNTVTFFGNVWATMMEVAVTSTAAVMKAVATLGIVAINAMGAMFNGVANVIGLIPGMGDKMDGAKKAFKSWRDDAVSNLQDMKKNADTFSGSLDRANKVRKLQADIRSWKAQIQIAKDRLKSVPKSKQAKLKADIEDLKRKVAAAKAKIDSIKGKTVNVTVNVRETSSGAQHGGVFHRATGGVVGMAHGGISRAQTGGVRSNLTLVGEAGPELVKLPPGSHVRSNPDTKRLMGRSGSQNAAQFLFKSSGRRADDMLLEMLREAIHQRGGDPVKVLGGR